MPKVFYILASIAAVIVIVAVPVLAFRALALMARLEDTRHDLSELIAEAVLSLEHVNRFLARSQEGVDRLRHALERVERLLALLQPAAAVGGVLAGARRVFSGKRPPAESSAQPEHEGDHS